MLVNISIISLLYDVLRRGQGCKYHHQRKCSKVPDYFNESLKNVCFSKQGYNFFNQRLVK